MRFTIRPVSPLTLSLTVTLPNEQRIEISEPSSGGHEDRSLRWRILQSNLTRTLGCSFTSNDWCRNQRRRPCYRMMVIGRIVSHVNCTRPESRRPFVMLQALSSRACGTISSEGKARRRAQGAPHCDPVANSRCHSRYGQDGCHQPDDLLIWAGGDIDRAWRTGCEQRCPRAVCCHAHPLIEQAFSRPAIGTERGGWFGGAVPRLALFGGLSQLASKLSELMADLSVRR